MSFGSAGWRLYLPELRLQLVVPSSEPDLAILPQLTDPNTARTLIEQAMRFDQSVYHDVRIQACSPEVLRYHPGMRATLEERDDAFRWVLRDRAGQRLFIFMDDGRVRAYVHAEVHPGAIIPQGSSRAVRVSMVPCDLMLADLRRYGGPS